MGILWNGSKPSNILWSTGMNYVERNLGPINTWTIPSTTTDVVSYSGTNTISLNGKGGHYETCYKSFTVSKSGSYTISYDYDLPNINFYGNSDSNYMHFGIYITTTQPPGGNMSSYASYTSGNCNGTDICGPSSQYNTPGTGHISFNYTLTAGTTYYLWIPMMNLADGVQTYLTFTNLNVKSVEQYYNTVEPELWLNGDKIWPDIDPLVASFYFLTYFYKNPDGTIRTYQSGNRVDVTPTANMSTYKSKTASYGTGTLNYASSTSRSSSGYTTTYSLTPAQQNYWRTGAVQYEYIFNFTSWAECGNIIPLSSFLYMHILDWQSGRFEFLVYCNNPNYSQSSISRRDNKWNTFTNYEWISFQSNKSNWSAGTYHLVCTLDLVNKKTLFWINGVLQGVVVWKDTFINNRKNELATKTTLNLNTANLASTVWISQLGIRPAVWTAEQNYTPLSKPYLSTEEYY